MTYEDGHHDTVDPIRLCNYETRGYCNEVAGWVRRDDGIHAVAACPACERRMLDSEARARNMRRQRTDEMMRYNYGVCF